MTRDLSAFFHMARIGRMVGAPRKPDAWASDPDRTTRREAYGTSSLAGIGSFRY